MGFPVQAALTDLNLVFGKIADKIADAAKMSLDTTKFATDKLAWVTDYIFEKLKWIPAATILSIIITLFRHPLEFITRILCAIIISIFFVFYIILTIPPFSWLAFIVWFIVRHVLILIGFTVVSLAIFCIIALIFILLAIVNGISGGSLTQLALCQTSPFAWYTVPNYQDGNKYDRGFFCNRPCAAGYSPDELTGSICNRTPLAQPSFCPQAEVMRILLKKNWSGERHIYANYVMTPSYFLKLPKEKEEDYIKHFDQMQLFFNKCNRRLGTFNNIALDICSSLDAIKELKMNVLSDGAIQKLKEVCKQGFCNSRSRHVFCSSFGDSNAENAGNGLLKAIIFMLVALVLFVFLVVMTYKFVSASTR
jgi:hypothetical protein